MPFVGESSPPIVLSRVVFPEPEGPSSAMNSPDFIFDENPEMTDCDFFPFPYFLKILFRLIMVCIVYETVLFVRLDFFCYSRMVVACNYYYG